MVWRAPDLLWGDAMETKLGQKYASEMSLITVNENIRERFKNIYHTYIINITSIPEVYVIYELINLDLRIKQLRVLIASIDTVYLG